MTRNNLYLKLGLACLLGYFWLIINIYKLEFLNISEQTVCPIKHLTTVPCPSCGSTRAVLELIKGGFTNSLYLNPFGIIIGLIMLICPIWILLDLALKKNSFMVFYQFSEHVLQRKNIAFICISLVLANWIWNINKGF
jgi:hypothetical protein